MCSTVSIHHYALKVTDFIHSMFFIIVERIYALNDSILQVYKFKGRGDITNYYWRIANYQ